MKTTKPNKINYTTQYQLMRIAELVMPLMPEAILDKFSAHTTALAEWSDTNADHIHPDRYDIAQDWHCTAAKAIRQKISSTK